MTTFFDIVGAKATDKGIRCQLGSEKWREFMTARIGIAWPGPGTPGYYCILAMEHQLSKSGVRPLVLVAEGQHEALADMIRLVAGD